MAIWSHRLDDDVAARKTICEAYSTCRQHLSRSKAKSVLILGSTPELRDLCTEIGVERTVVVDHSRVFYEDINAHRVYSPADEEVIIDTWQHVLPRLKSQFDCVMGDLVSGNVPYDEREDFYAAIAGTLNPGGSFVEKILTNKSGCRSLDLLDQHYLRELLNLETINDFANAYFFTSELVANKGIVDARSIRETLHGRFTAKPLLAKLLAFTEYVVPESGLWYYGAPWSIVEAFRARSLEVVESFPETENNAFRGRLQIDVMKPVAGLDI